MCRYGCDMAEIADAGRLKGGDGLVENLVGRHFLEALLQESLQISRRLFEIVVENTIPHTQVSFARVLERWNAQEWP